MEKLKARLQHYKRLSKLSFCLLLFLLPIQFWQAVQAFNWLRGVLVSLSLMALGLLFYVRLVLRQVEKGLED